MNKLFLAIAVLLFGLSQAHAETSISFPFETSFGCEEWQETGYPSWALVPSACEEFRIGLEGKDASGDRYQTQITAAANNPLGTGSGARFYKYPGADNYSSSIARHYFASNQTEFWLRWYMRSEDGFTWGSGFDYSKLIYLYYDNTPLAGFEYKGANEMMFWGTGAQMAKSGDGGWYDQHGYSAVSDGSWHCHEIHVKMDTNGTDGVSEYWLDGVKKISVSNWNWSGGNATIRSQGFGGYMFTHNNSDPAAEYYVDWDDMAISTTGYIGPIGESPPEDTGWNLGAGTQQNIGIGTVFNIE